MNFQNYNKVIAQLWQETTDRNDLHVYGILDCARSEKIYPALVRTNMDYRCLYAVHQAVFLGELPQVLAEAAPHIVKLDPEALLTRWLVSRGWGDSWGIFVVSSAGLRDLLRHFRRFLMVRDEKGKAFYFRFYDPRVLRVYLPTCSADELKILFGPVRQYYVEEEDAASLLEYRRVDSALASRNIPVIPPDQQELENKQDAPAS